MNTIKNPVAIARYSSISMTDKEYILDDKKRIKCFFNKDSAELFLVKVLGVPEEQLSWYLYENVHTCSKCKITALESDSPMYSEGDKLLCDTCYSEVEV